MESTVSAPGKVILFGEHAVVYGVTAIATAVSDLRLRVIARTSGLPHIHILLHDIKAADGSPFQISFPQNIRTIGDSSFGDPYHPRNPDESRIKELKNYIADDPSLPSSQCVMAILYLVSSILPDFENLAEQIRDVKGINIEVKSVGLPIGAGLGSSAAFSVALAASLLQLRYKLLVSCMSVRGGESAAGEALSFVFRTAGTSNEESSLFSSPSSELLELVNAWAYAAEVVIHGSPSGLDNTTSCFGGSIKYSKDSGKFEKLPGALPNLEILLTNTKVPRSTKVLVAGVKVLYDRYPKVVKPILESIEHISLRYLAMVERSNAELGIRSTADVNAEEMAAADTVSIRWGEELSDLFRVNHNLLCALGVGHPALTAVCETAAALGLATKLTGAGGGGCAITLLPKDGAVTGSREKGQGQEDGRVVALLSERLSALGYESFRSAIGGKGVLWHST